jgi:hypothetical protein
VALVKPPHSGDPDVMQFSRSSEVRAPCSLARNRGLSTLLPIVLFGPPRVRSNISASESNSATIPNQELATSRLGGELRFRDRFLTETLRSWMLYAENVGGPSQAPTKSFIFCLEHRKYSFTDQLYNACLISS